MVPFILWGGLFHCQPGQVRCWNLTLIPAWEVTWYPLIRPYYSINPRIPFPGFFHDCLCYGTALTDSSPPFYAGTQGMMDTSGLVALIASGFARISAYATSHHWNYPATAIVIFFAALTLIWFGVWVIMW